MSSSDGDDSAPASRWSRRRSVVVSEEAVACVHSETEVERAERVHQALVAAETSDIASPAAPTVGEVVPDEQAVAVAQLAGASEFAKSDAATDTNAATNADADATATADATVNVKPPGQAVGQAQLPSSSSLENVVGGDSALSDVTSHIWRMLEEQRARYEADINQIRREMKLGMAARADDGLTVQVEVQDEARTKDTCGGPAQALAHEVRIEGPADEVETHSAEGQEESRVVPQDQVRPVVQGSGEDRASSEYGSKVEAGEEGEEGVKRGAGEAGHQEAESPNDAHENGPDVMDEWEPAELDFSLELAESEELARQLLAEEGQTDVATESEELAQPSLAEEGQTDVVVPVAEDDGGQACCAEKGTHDERDADIAGDGNVDGAADSSVAEGGGVGGEEPAPDIATHVVPSTWESLPPSALPAGPLAVPLTPRPATRAHPPHEAANESVEARPASPIDSPVPTAPDAPDQPAIDANADANADSYPVANADAVVAAAAAAAAELRIADVRRIAQAEVLEAKQKADKALARATEMDDELRAARDEAKLVRRQNEELREVLHKMYRQQDFERERVQANAARSGRAVEMLAEAHAALLTAQKELETQLVESRAERAAEAARAQHEIDSLRSQLAQLQRSPATKAGQRAEASPHLQPQAPSALKEQVRSYQGGVAGQAFKPPQTSRSVKAAKARLSAGAGAGISTAPPTPQPKPQHPSWV